MLSAQLLIQVAELQSSAEKTQLHCNLSSEAALSQLSAALS